MKTLQYVFVAALGALIAVGVGTAASAVISSGMNKAVSNFELANRRH